MRNRNDLSPSDFDRLEHQHAWFDELDRFAAGNRRRDREKEGCIIPILKWLIVGMIVIAWGISAFVYMVSP